jgi:hypothetical protein
MTLMTTPRLKRIVGQVAVVGALALLLSGLAAPLASAQTRQEAVDQANGFIDWCYANGGDPIVVGAGTDAESSVVVVCKFSDGSSFVCSFYPNASCHQYPPLVRPPKSIGDELGGGGGSLSDGGAMNGQAAESLPKGGVSVPVPHLGHSRHKPKQHAK